MVWETTQLCLGTVQDGVFYKVAGSPRPLHGVETHTFVVASLGNLVVVVPDSLTKAQTPVRLL